MRIAVALFAYNRPKYLKRALKTHTEIEQLDYFAFVDYSEIQHKVVGLIPDYYVIRERWTHYGLDKNITEGITEILENYDAVIVLEDDLLLKRGGIQELAGYLELLKSCESVGSVSLYSNKNMEFQSWAWATWKDRWEKHKYIEGNGTQAQQFYDFHKENNLYCITPDKSKVKHIGWKGEHFRWLDFFSIRRLWRLVCS